MASQGKDFDKVLCKLRNHGRGRWLPICSGCLAAASIQTGSASGQLHSSLSRVVALSAGSSALANVRFENCSADRATASLGLKPEWERMGSKFGIAS